MAVIHTVYTPPLPGVLPAHLEARASDGLNSVSVSLRYDDPDAAVSLLRELAGRAEALLAEDAKRRG